MEWVSLGRLGHPRHRKNMSGERREGGGVGDKRIGSGKRGVWLETSVSRAIKKNVFKLVLKQSYQCCQLCFQIPGCVGKEVLAGPYEVKTDCTGKLSSSFFSNNFAGDLPLFSYFTLYCLTYNEQV